MKAWVLNCSITQYRLKTQTAHTPFDSIDRVSTHRPLGMRHHFLLLLLACPVINGDLVQVYTINRHGARNVLRKDANLTESDANGGPTLLPQGRAMVNAAGAAFRSRYIDPSTCNATCLGVSSNGTLYGVYGTPDTGFTNYNTFVRAVSCTRA